MKIVSYSAGVLFVLFATAAILSINITNTLLLVVMFSILAVMATGWLATLLFQYTLSNMRDVRKNEALLRAILNNSAEGMITVDENCMILTFNKACERMFGYTFDEVEGKSAEMLFPADLNIKCESFVESNRKNSPGMLIGAESREVEGLKKDGNIFPLEVSLSVIEQDGKRIFSGVLRDLSERKESQELRSMMEQIHDSRGFLQNIINHVADPIFVKDREHRWIGGNNAFWALMGRPESEVVGKSDYDYFSREEADVFWAKDEEVFEYGGININIENLTDPQGNTHIISTKKACFIDPEGKRILVGVIRDITELRQAQEKLKQSDEARLKSIMDHAGRLMWIKDLEGRYMQVNRDILQEYGITENEIIGLTDNDIFPPEYAAALYRNDLRVIKEEQSLEFEETLPHLDGTHIYTSIRFPLYDASERVYAICGISNDITERKQSEAKLRQTLEELVKANTELERFAYICSHDLQEPLRMISNYTQRLSLHLDDKLDEKAQHYMKYIIDGASQARELIHDILNYSRVGAETEKPEPVDCQQIINRILANLETSIQDSGAVITYNKLPVISGHPTQITQLFQNLLTNAIKFRSTNPPRIHIEALQRDNDWEFSVRDNGIGIAPEYKEKVFKIFQRLGKRGEYPGTGIGLAICKKIVEQSEGKIWLESEPQQGATFYFTLPQVTLHKEDGNSLRKTG